MAGETVSIPFGTTVFIELEQRVTSKKKETAEGDVVRAHVWRDVRVGGNMVIEAGTPVFTRVSEVKKAKIAGRKGRVHLESLNVVAVDGSDLPLDGGYDRSGRGRMGLSIALAAVVALPLIFIRGKQAVLEPGTIFDALVRGGMEVEVPREASARPKLTVAQELVVTVLYDDMNPDEKIKFLPLKLVANEFEITEAAVVAVNGEEIEAIPIAIQGDATTTVLGMVDFKQLSKHFSKGMNRLGIEAGGERTEVLLEIEF